MGMDPDPIAAVASVAPAAVILDVVDLGTGGGRRAVAQVGPSRRTVGSDADGGPAGGAATKADDAVGCGGAEEGRYPPLTGRGTKGAAALDPPPFGAAQGCGGGPSRWALGAPEGWNRKCGC